MRKQKTISRLFSIVAKSQSWLRAIVKPKRPRRGQKGQVMKTIHTSPALGKRVFSGFAALAALFALAACGGGGGGSGPTAGTPPPAPAPAPTTPPAPAPAPAPSPAPAASVTINSVGDCSMVGDTCVIEVSFNAKATTNSRAYVPNFAGDQSVLNGDGQKISFSITGAKPGDVLEVVFEDGTGKQLAAATASANCATGHAWQIDVGCLSAVPSSIVYYDRANLVVSGEVFKETSNGTLAVGYPQVIVGTTMIPLRNLTGVQVGLCMLSSGVLDATAGLYQGLPSAACVQPQLGNIRAVFPIDPVAMKLLPKYEGALPAGLTHYAGPYGTFGDSPYVAYGVSQSGTFIDVPGVGTYYFTDTRGDELRLTRDGFQTYEVLQTGQTFNILTTYSHPRP